MKHVFTGLILLLAAPSAAQAFEYLGTNVTIDAYGGLREDPSNELDLRSMSVSSRTNLSFGQVGLQIDLARRDSYWGFDFANNHIGLQPWYQFSPTSKVGLYLGYTDNPNYMNTPGYQGVSEYGLSFVSRPSDKLSYQIALTEKPYNAFMGRRVEEIQASARYHLNETLALRGDVFAATSVSGSGNERTVAALVLRAEYTPPSIPNLSYFGGVEALNGDFINQGTETRLRVGITMSFGKDDSALPMFERNDYIREFFAYD